MRRFIPVAVLLSLALCCGCVHNTQREWRFNDSVNRKPKLPRKLKTPEYEPPPPTPQEFADDQNLIQQAADCAMYRYGSGDPNVGQGQSYHR
jgi:hypothetical protein